MTPRTSFYRKIVYAAMIVALLVPTALLSLPAVTVDEGGPGGLQQRGGGVLDQVREKHGLNNARLGDVDPTSETIKLALLGFRGVAANILWAKAHEYKKKEDWSKMIATVDTITLLQPYFEQVWWFQGWNIAYNVSVEWDDYRDRYYWVKQGVDYLLRGVRRNNDSPTLLYWTGWVISHKMGKSDEKTQFRALFRNDDEFHNEIFAQDQKLAYRDSWYVGKQYMLRAHEVVDRFDRKFKGTAKSIFYASPGLNNFYWALALVAEGVLSDEIRERWSVGEQEWSGTQRTTEGVLPLGERPLALALEPHIKIELNDREMYVERQQKAWKQLSELVEQATSEKIPPQLYDPDERAFSERLLDAETLVEALPENLKKQAEPILEEIRLVEHRQHWISQYRDVVNYSYWKMRSQAEQSPDAAIARSKLVAANQALKVDADLWTARDDYATTLEHWRLILDAYPDLAEDDLTAEDVFVIVSDYQTVLNQLEDPFPPAGYGLVALSEVRDWDAFRAALLRHDGPTDAQGPAAVLSQAVWNAIPEALRQTLRVSDKQGGLTKPEKLAVLAVLNEQISSNELTSLLAGYAADGDAELAAQIEAAQDDDLTQRDRRLLNRQLVDQVWSEQITPADRQHFVLWELVGLHQQVAQSKGLPVDRIMRTILPSDRSTDVVEPGPMSLTPGNASDEPASVPQDSPMSTTPGT